MPTPSHRVLDRDGAGTHAYMLVGPTATGKSTVAQRIAETHDLGILSADSMLVYQGMNVGTAKPTIEERGDVPYWGVDLVSPHDVFSVGRYLQEARKAFAAAQAARRALVVVGGTGLYIKGMLHGLDSFATPSPEIRDRVQDWFAAEGRDGLARRLQEAAPDRYAALQDPLNPRRLMRALELHLGGEEVPSGWGAIPAPCIVGLRMDRVHLAERIQVRIHRMYAGGLLAEAAALRESNPEISVTAREAIGYAEAFAVLDGKLSPDQAMERTAIRTRQLAKRQMTWFRRKLKVSWVSVPPDPDVDEVAEQVLTQWEELGPAPLRMEVDHG